jgi:hypothetical protein
VRPNACCLLVCTQHTQMAASAERNCDGNVRELQVLECSNSSCGIESSAMAWGVLRWVTSSSGDAGAGCGAGLRRRGEDWAFGCGCRSQLSCCRAVFADKEYILIVVQNPNAEERI